MHSQEQDRAGPMHQDRSAWEGSLPLSRGAGRQANHAWQVLQGAWDPARSLRGEPQRPHADGAQGHPGRAGCDRSEDSRAGWAVRHGRLPRSSPGPVRRRIRRNRSAGGQGETAGPRGFAPRGHRRGWGLEGIVAISRATSQTAGGGVENTPFSCQCNQRGGHGGSPGTLC